MGSKELPNAAPLQQGVAALIIQANGGQ